MGFLDQLSNATDIPAHVLMPEFQANCTLSVIGQLQTFLNDERKEVFTLQEASVLGLRQGNPAASMRIPELFVRKDQCQIVAFDQQFAPDQMGLMPRHERLALYTSHYVIQGDFYMGTDSLISDFIHTAKQFYIAGTDVSIFPLFTPQTAVLQHAPLAYVHRTAVRIHHAL